MIKLLVCRKLATNFIVAISPSDLFSDPFLNHNFTHRLTCLFQSVPEVTFSTNNFLFRFRPEMALRKSPKSKNEFSCQN